MKLKRIRPAFSLLLAASLILSILFVPIAQVGAQDPIGDEIVGLRTQYSNTYENFDGSYYTIKNIGSVNYETIDGGYYPIQTDIHSSPKPNWDWEVESGHWQLYIKNDTTVGIRKWDNWIGHRLHGIAYLDIETKDYIILQTCNSGMPIVSGNKIEWTEILYGVDYRLYYTNDSLKEDVIIKQKLRDLLNTERYRPADYGLNTATTYLVPIFEMDWSQSLPMKLASGQNVSPDEAEHEETIYFKSPVKDKYFDTNLVSYMPLDYAVSANPVNPEDPEDEWEYAIEKIRKRLIKRNDKHWLLMGVRVVRLNQMPEGDIVFDPTETLRPNAAGDLTDIPSQTPDSTFHWDKVDEAVSDESTTMVVSDTADAPYDLDLYNLPASSGAGVINKITVYGHFAHNTGLETNQKHIKIAVKIGGTTDYGPEEQISETYWVWVYKSNEWALNPDDSDSWEWADIDALQIGIAIRVPNTSPSGTTMCSQVYVVVDYVVLVPPDPPTNIIATDGVHTNKVVITWTKSAGATKYEVFRDGGGLGELGDVATYDDNGANAPTITPGTASASDGTQTAHVVLSLAGESANNGTTHTYKVKAGNDSGWSGFSGTDTGYRGVGVLTYQWQRSAADSDAAYGNIGGATSDPYNDVGALAPTVTPGTASATDGTEGNYVTLSVAGESANTFGRYYKCVLNATGATQQTSTNDRGYRGVGSITYQWQRSAGDADAGYGVLGGATSDPFNDTTAPAGIITPGTASASDGTDTAHITLSVTGESMTDGVGRWYYCEVSATGATTQDTTHNRGYRGGGALNYQWQRSNVDGDSGYGPLGGATTDPFNDTTAPAGVITPGTMDASDGTDTAHVVLTIAGHSVADGAGRWYYCEVSSPDAVTQDTTHDRGHRTTGAITIQMQRSAADSDAAYGNIGGATSNPYNDTGAPPDGSGRWYLGKLDATGTAQAETTHDRGFRLIVAPTVTIQAASSIDKTTATGNGNITNTGGPNCDERGFDYDIDSGAPYAYDATDVGSYGTGAYTKGLTGLDPGTIYYIRAKAHNSVGWGYGSEETFCTLPGDVTGFSITATTDFTATLAWTNGSGADKTMVRYKMGSYPTNIGDGTQAYFDTASSVTVSALTPGERYYFSAWAYDSDSGLYSSGVAQDEDYTHPGQLVSLAVLDRSKEANEVDIRWYNGVGGDITVIRRSLGGYPTSPTAGDPVYDGTGTFFTDNFTGKTTYYSGWAKDSDSGYYSMANVSAVLLVITASDRVSQGIIKAVLPVALAAFVIIVMLLAFKHGDARQAVWVTVGAIFGVAVLYYIVSIWTATFLAP